MYIYVNKLFPRETIELKVQPKDTIQDVKKKIQTKQGIPADQQTIIFAGSRFKNHVKLKDCNIGNDSTLHLVLAFSRKIKIYMKLLPGSGNIFCLDILDKDLVDCLKRKIEQQVGIKSDKQTISFAGIVLKSGTSLESYGIVDGSCVDLNVNQ